MCALFTGLRTVWPPGPVRAEPSMPRLPEQGPAAGGPAAVSPLRQAGLSARGNRLVRSLFSSRIVEAAAAGLPWMRAVAAP